MSGAPKTAWESSMGSTTSYVDSHCLLIAVLEGSCPTPSLLHNLRVSLLGSPTLPCLYPYSEYLQLGGVYSS